MVWLRAGAVFTNFYAGLKPDWRQYKHMTIMGKITLNSVVIQTEGFVSAHLDGETFLMSIEEGTYFGFDTILSRIWEDLKSPISVSDHIDKLLENYDVARQECEADVLDVLKDMYDDDLISVQ